MQTMFDVRFIFYFTSKGLPAFLEILPDKKSLLLLSKEAGLKQKPLTQFGQVRAQNQKSIWKFLGIYHFQEGFDFSENTT